MGRVRIQKQKVHHRHTRDADVPSLDPRDPDVVRTKRLGRSSQGSPRARAERIGTLLAVRRSFEQTHTAPESRAVG